MQAILKFLFHLKQGQALELIPLKNYQFVAHLLLKLTVC